MKSDGLYPSSIVHATPHHHLYCYDEQHGEQPHYFVHVAAGHFPKVKPHPLVKMADLRQSDDEDDDCPDLVHVTEPIAALEEQLQEVTISNKLTPEQLGPLPRKKIPVTIITGFLGMIVLIVV